MTQLLNPVCSRGTAEHVALRGLLNAYLRETGQRDPRIADAVPPSRGGGGSALRIALPTTGRTLTGELTCWSAVGHHDYGASFQLDGQVATYQDLVAAVLDEVGHGAAADEAGKRRLAAQIADSTERISRYLAGRRPAPGPGAAARTRHAEQSVLIGHPMHPTPKSAEGFTDADLAAYAPEQGAGFRLEYLAISPDLADERRTAPGEWIPPAVAATVPDGMLALPVHPWQARHLAGQPAFQALVDAGQLLPLGPLGDPVYPTSSVRSVCDPAFETVWKLPLRVRITNFFRTNPIEHARRAADASRLVAALREGWSHPGFDVLIETGHRTVRHPELAEDLTVIFRENPFVDGRHAPQVLAALLEERPGGEPDLLAHLREAGGGVSESVAAEWLRRYLAISLTPALRLWAEFGVSLEAHVQNSMLHLEAGWPDRLWVRDMEGVSVSRQRIVNRGLVASDSPVLYDDTEAWLRLKYYLVTNHLGHLLHVLGRHSATPEHRLWAVVDEVLAEHADPYSDDLRRCATLPAKANLTSRLAERGERPLYVQIPNPIREASR